MSTQYIEKAHLHRRVERKLRDACLRSSWWRMENNYSPNFDYWRISVCVQCTDVCLISHRECCLLFGLVLVCGGVNSVFMRTFCSDTREAATLSIGRVERELSPCAPQNCQEKCQIVSKDFVRPVIYVFLVSLCMLWLYGFAVCLIRYKSNKNIISRVDLPPSERDNRGMDRKWIVVNSAVIWLIRSDILDSFVANATAKKGVGLVWINLRMCWCSRWCANACMDNKYKCQMHLDTMCESSNDIKDWRCFQYKWLFGWKRLDLWWSDQSVAHCKPNKCTDLNYMERDSNVSISAYPFQICLLYINYNKYAITSTAEKKLYIQMFFLRALNKSPQKNLKWWPILNILDCIYSQVNGGNNYINSYFMLSMLVFIQFTLIDFFFIINNKWYT